jgi:hypothetical protein
VVDCHDPRLVLLALQAGGDPGLADGLSHWTPRVHWLRRAHASGGSACAQQGWPGAEQQQAWQAVQQRMGLPSAQELAVGYQGNGETLLWDVFQSPDRAVKRPLLQQLLALGARPDQRDMSGNSFLQSAPVLDEATLAMLAQLPPDVLRALGQVQPTIHQPRPVPLVQAARQRGDTGLAQLLCRHGAAGC